MLMLVTGASGQLGTDLLRIPSENHVAAPLTRGDSDVTDRQSLKSVVASAQADIIIHAAAYRDVARNREESR